MMKAALIVMVVCLTAAASLHAQSDEWRFGAAAERAPQAEVRTKKIVIFKDGYAMFVKEVKAVGGAVIEDVPESMVLGSFWITPRNGSIAGTFATKRTPDGRDGAKRLEFVSHPAAAAKVSEFELMYYAPGLRWIPTYRISLISETEAELSLQAELLNEAEDFYGADVDLVVGVPNFRFKEVVSPMSLVEKLVNRLVTVAPQLMSQSMSNMAFQRRSEFRNDLQGAVQPGGVMEIPNELVGTTQDLFTYNIPKLSLRNGERATIPLVAAKVPLRHLYTWDMHMRRSGVETLADVGRHASPVRLLKNDVWHFIELKNSTNVPLTTGAALIMQGYMPLGQELLTYTSRGGICQIPVTVAVDIRGTFDEKETAREAKAAHYNGNDYTRIAKQATLRVANYKDRPVDIVINSQFGGNATEASDEGGIAVSDFQREDWPDNNNSMQSALNGHSTVSWSLTLKPGETREVTCDYHYFAR